MGFSFEKKIGLSEICSVLALAVSLVAAWYARAQVAQNLPEVFFERHTAIRIGSSALSDSEMAMLIPITIGNRGGRTVTLVKFESGELPAILRITNGRVSGKSEADVSVAFIESINESEGLIDQKILTAETRPLKLPLLLNQSIESGKARTFILLVRIRDQENRSLKSAQFALNLHAAFSDGTVQAFNQGIGFPQQ